MKLSEAILKGCKTTKQGFGAYHPAPGLACAIGAAYDAIGVPDDEIHDTVGFDCVLLPWPEDIECVNGCLGNLGAAVVHVGATVVHMNDCLRMTREEIAAVLAQKGF